MSISQNLWSKIPPPEAYGRGDVIADPYFADVGSPYLLDWFRLLGTSPVIDHAL